MSPGNSPVTVRVTGITVSPHMLVVFENVTVSSYSSASKSLTRSGSRERVTSMLCPGSSVPPGLSTRIHGAEATAVQSNGISL